MEFDIRKPKHVMSLIILIVALFLLFINPVLSYLNFFLKSETVDFSEIIIFLSIFIFIPLLLCAPLTWYFFVNKYSKKEILYALKLRSQGIDSAFLWGIIAVILIFVITFLIELILIYVIGVNEDAISRITDTAADLSIISMILIVIQSISVEIFFRGFLLEKIDAYAGKNIAITITAILYGLACISFGDIYPSIIPIIMGLLLGYIVIKTKNLYSAITAQLLFNFTSFILLIIVNSLNV